MDWDYGQMDPLVNMGTIKMKCKRDLLIDKSPVLCYIFVYENWIR